MKNYLTLFFVFFYTVSVAQNADTLMFHGEMTTIALEHCENIRLQNIHVDFERPAGSEMTYTKVSEGAVEMNIHPDTRYEIVNGRMSLYGEGWYESGPVCDVLIKNNTFIDCAHSGGPGNAIIALHPSNTVIDANRPVHCNVRIENNIFKTFDYPVLYAKSTAQLSFKDNTITGTKTLSPQAANTNTFYLNGCKDVVIRGNSFEDYTPKQLVKMENMKSKYLKIK